MRAATDTKSAAAVCTTAVSASVPDPTAASPPHDTLTNTNAAVTAATAITATTAKSAANTAGAAGTSASMPSRAHQSTAAVQPSTNSATSSTAADGRTKPLAAVHPAVAPAAVFPPSAAPAAVSPSPVAPALTQATAPLRDEESVTPTDGHADRVAPISSIIGAEMIHIFLVRDAPSMADAASALGAERGVQGADLLRNALRATGPIAVRLDGRDLGAEDGVIQTVQVS